MPTVLSHLNVSIFTEEDRLSFWTGSPSSSGGELVLVNASPVGGPPQFDYDATGKDRTPYKFDVETKIPGADLTAQKAFIARYAPGTVFPSDSITGLPDGIDFVVQSANVTHNDGEDPSTLEITLHEVGPTTP